MTEVTNDKSNFLVHHDKGSKPIKHWTRDVPLEASALQQLRNTAKMLPGLQMRLRRRPTG